MSTASTCQGWDLDSAQFRAVLGNYPTGVVVVTAQCEDGPVGMVIGSFTSVSLNPPLVAFLPMKTSRTYERLRTASSFCVNVLSASQEEVCRAIATEGSAALESIRLRPAPSGAPILDGVVAWIDCAPGDVHEAGDHFIVLGRVTDTGIESEGVPLLFFQGGYGGFAAGSLVLQRGGQGLVAAVRLALNQRAQLEEIAEELKCECTVIAMDGDEGVFVASAAASGLVAAAPIGARIPISAPLQGLFVSDAGPVTRERWLSSLGRDQVARDDACAMLDRVAARGWSVGVIDGEKGPDMDSVTRDYASGPRTPARERAFLATVSMGMEREPCEIQPDADYRISYVAVAVQGRAPEDPVLVLKLGQLNGPVRGVQVLDWIARLKGMAERFEQARTASA
jgi:flavin reductase (DIM6/NTAB) family NADH-FMN oxidoreductase RutF